MIRTLSLASLLLFAGTCGDPTADGAAAPGPTAAAEAQTAGEADSAAPEPAPEPVAIRPAASTPPAAPAPAVPPTLGEPIRISADLVVRPLGDRAWVFVHEKPYPANNLLVEADDGQLLLVDTPYTPRATREMLGWIESRFGKRRIQAVNTHFHLDALGGNEALREAGIGPRGLLSTAELLASRGDQRRRELADELEGELRKEIEGLTLLRPAALYMAGKFTLPFGSETYELIFPGPAHSPDNLVVWLPARRLLFGGCMVKDGASLGFTGDADLGHWPEAIRQLQKLDPAVVVIGHGARIDPGVLDRTLELLAAAPQQDPPPPQPSDAE